jgi:hypothetical protein
MGRAVSDCIVVTWAEPDGLEPTGRTVLRDGYHRNELRAVWKARALVYSRNMSLKPQAEDYAKACGYTVRVLDDTADVLSRARALELAERKAVPV